MTIYLLFAAYYLAIAALMVSHRMSLAPDQAFVVLLAFSLFIKRWREFLKDWTLPIASIIFYDFLRGILPHLTPLPHANAFRIGRLLIGTSFPDFIQAILTPNASLNFTDYLFTVIYMLHFITLTFMGYLFWLKKRSYFQNYIWTIVLVSYMGLITFILFPTLPPWLAGAEGYIPTVQKIYDSVTATFPNGWAVPSIYKFIKEDLFAAVPSLHVAYPWIILLFVDKYLRKLFVPTAIYFFLVSFGVMYLGEHFLFDIISGVVYGTIAFLAITQLWPKYLKNRLPSWGIFATDPEPE